MSLQLRTDQQDAGGHSPEREELSAEKRQIPGLTQRWKSPCHHQPEWRETQKPKGWGERPHAGPLTKLLPRTSTTAQHRARGVHRNTERSGSQPANVHKAWYPVTMARQENMAHSQEKHQPSKTNPEMTRIINDETRKIRHLI